MVQRSVPASSKVHRKCVPQRMMCHRLGELRHPMCLAAGGIYGACRYRFSSNGAGKHPCPGGSHGAPITVVYGYGVAQTMVKVLQMCGDDLTRANVMKQTASLKGFSPDTLLPGIKIDTSPTDFAPISSLKIMRFKGEKWDLFGDIITAGN